MSYAVLTSSESGANSMADINANFALAAPLASPALTGNPTAPTASAADNDTSIATTAFVQQELTSNLAAKAPLASPALTGNPTAPTASAADNDTSIATTAFVQQEIAAKAPLASPALTGNPTAPTASAADNDTSIATTAFVQANKVGYVLGFSGSTPGTTADATTYYFGFNPYALSVGGSAGFAKIRIPKTGTIKSCYVELVPQGVFSSGETSTMSIRLNNTSDTTISASVVASSSTNSFSNTVLSIAVVAGDYIEIKWVTPTWATNPTVGVHVFGNIYIE